MAKKNTNKAYEPFTIYPPCVCPNCKRPRLMRLQSEHSLCMIDEDGVDRIIQDAVVENKFICAACGFTTDNFIDTDSGWRYSPSGDDEYIKRINEKPSLHNWRDKMKKNPFIKE